MNTIWVSLFVVAGVFGCLGAPGPDCSPATIHEQPPRMRNMCAALYQIANVVQAAYMDDQPNYQPMLRDDIYDKVKRQDVDHVFLRFGRRR